GKVSDNGTFLRQLKPGVHDVGFQSAGRNSATVRKHFVAGQTTNVNGAEMRVLPAVMPPPAVTPDSIRKSEDRSVAVKTVSPDVSPPASVSQKPIEPPRDVGLDSKSSSSPSPVEAILRLVGRYEDLY